MNSIESICSLIGRIFISYLFLISGFMKIPHFAATEKLVASAGLTKFTAFLVVLAMLSEIIGGLSVLLGIFGRFGALILTVFMIIVTIIFHLKFTDQSSITMFMYHIVTIGGLFIIMAFGTGKISIDTLLKKKQ